MFIKFPGIALPEYVVIQLLIVIIGNTSKSEYISKRGEP